MTMTETYHVFEKCIKGHYEFYFWYYSNGIRKQRKCRGCSSRKEALQYVNFLPPPDMLESVKVKHITKDMYIEGSSFLRSKEAHGKKFSKITLQSKRNYIDRINRIWGDYEITDINVNMVENYLAGLNLSGSWKNSFLETLVEIYRESQKFGINPVIPKFERYKRNSKKADIFSENEISTLLKKDNYKDEMFYLMNKVTLSCGLRKGELQGLRVCQIDFENRVVVIDGFIDRSGKRTNYNKKGSDENPKLRFTFITDELANELKEYINNTGKKDDEFIFSDGHHDYVEARKINTEFSRILKLCGIEKNGRKLCPHSLRYTFITKMRRIVPAETVQKLAGHNSLEMTEYYTRMNIADSIRSDEMVDLRDQIQKIFS